MADSTKEQYTDDAPISSHHDDRFGRWRFAERVAGVIATRTDSASIVVGVYGPWGDGKTSVLNMMIEALASHDSVIVIPFNPWNFESEGQLIRAFFDTLSDAIGKSLTTKAEELGKFLGKYGGVLSLASLPFGVDAGGAATTIGERLSNVELDELRARVGKILVDAGKRVVVFIDDIDRLDRREVHAILKLIKLSASFQNTSYVLAFDDDMVAASLGDRYGAGNVAAGRSFVEKIIQIPLHLPDAEPEDLRQLAFEGVDEVLSRNALSLSEEQVEAFVLHFEQGILPALRTPRQAKRYVNAIRFAVPLLKGEVHVVDHLLLEALRTAYPNLYLSIRANRDAYTGLSFTKGFGDHSKQKEAAKKTVEAGLEGLAADERRAAMHLLKALFPRLETVFGNTSYGDGSDSTWAKERRIAADDYFRRYFQYSVPSRDVADSDVDAFISSANSGSSAEATTFLETVTARKAWQRALDKLFAKRPELNATGSRTAALALAAVADKIPYERGMFAEMMAARNRAASLAVRMIQGIVDQQDRLKLAKEVVGAANSLSFGAECIRWLGHQSDKSVGTTALADDERKDVASILATRVAADIFGNPDYARHGRNIGTLLYYWKEFGPTGQMAGFFNTRFENDPTDAIKLLDAFIGRAWGLETGLSHKAEFDRSEFDAVAALIDPGLVVAALKKVFGTLLDSVDFKKCWELAGDQQTACRFVAIFSKVQEEDAPKVAASETMHSAESAPNAAAEESK
jgi:hypothetical protein